MIPGITAAAAAAADMGVSLTRRGRNGQVRLLTGYDINGFADYDWQSLALDGSVAVIYMGVRAAFYIQEKLLIHGASDDMPITIGQNVSCQNDNIWVSSSASRLVDDCRHYGITGTAILMLGLHPHNQRAALLTKKPIDSMHNLNKDLLNDGVFSKQSVDSVTSGMESMEAS